MKPDDLQLVYLTEVVKQPGDDDVLRGMKAVEDKIIIAKVLRNILAAAVEDYAYMLSDEYDKYMEDEDIFDLLTGRKRKTLIQYIESAPEHNSDISQVEVDMTKKAVLSRNFNIDDYGITADNMYDE